MATQNAFTHCRVLVVEDELMIALDLCGKLEGMGCTVLGPVSSVAAAMGLLETQRPDAALLDENLGGVPVTPVAQSLHRRRIPFAVVSGYSRPRSDDPDLAGAPRVTKPASTAMILDIMKRLCGAQST